MKTFKLWLETEKLDPYPYGVPEGIILRTKSHRAREKLDRTIGRHPQYWWTWEDSAVFAEVTPEEFEQIKAAKIKGITRARMDYSQLRKTIDWGGPV